MQVLGIDIGGSGIKGAPVDVKMGVMLTERYRIKTPKSGKPKPMAKIVAEIAQHYNWQGPIGCGFPAAVQQGIVRTASNVHDNWIGTHAANLISKTTGCPTKVINDADAAGLAEMKFGAGKGKQGVVLLITLGTGIGTAIFTEGQLLPNTELGHIEIECIEAEKMASVAIFENEGLSWEDWADRLDTYLHKMVGLLWPDLIIVGGGISKRHKNFLPLLTVDVEIIPAEMRNNAGIIGAALAGQP